MSLLWRALSVFVDEAVLSGRSIFRAAALGGDAGIAPPPFATLAAEHASRPPEVTLPARLERGDARPARAALRFPALDAESIADVHLAPRAAETLVVYHHGLAEFPHDASARGILPRVARATPLDWVALRAPHHEDGHAVSARLLASQASFGRALTGSVLAARAVGRALAARLGHRRLVLAGMSMGGVISLLDAALPGSPFSLHVPLMAGPDLADVLLRSSFSRLIAKRTLRAAVASPDVDRLDVAALLRAEGTPIRPILSTQDRLFRIDAQRAAYARVPRARVREIEAGHITGALSFGALAEHLTAAITESASEPARPRVEPISGRLVVAAA
jgi:hypothetical protein